MFQGADKRIIRANNIDFETACAGSGPDLAVLLHGFPEHAISWRNQIPALTGLGYRVLAPNLRGYGGSSVPEGVDAYALECLIDDVAALIESERARNVVLVGHDWGGVIAWFTAMRRRSLVDRLVVMNLPHPARYLEEVKRLDQMLKSWYILAFQIPRLSEWLLTRENGRVIRDIFLNMAVNKHRFSDEVLASYVANALRPGGMTAMLNYYRAAFRGGMARQVALGFPKIDIPTLMIWGEQDTALAKATTYGTEAHVSDLTLRYLPRASHWVQQDAPDEVNAILTAWLRGEAVPRYDRV